MDFLNPASKIPFNPNSDLASTVNSIPSFDIPQMANPVEFLKEHTTPGAQHYLKIEHGTTTLAFKFKHGVIIAVDSRATGGNYIAACLSLSLYELRNKERISVAAASKLLANMVYAYKGMGLSMVRFAGAYLQGTMVAGWDKQGPGLFYVDSDGTRMTNHLFSVGSGSTYAYGVLDAGYKYDLTTEEAIDLGRRAIYHATFRDAYSGGVVNLYHVKERGWEFISQDDVTELHYKYADEPRPSL
ncbi:Proteasome subunit beta type-8, partial [Kappamyces sp. JEL0680]